LIEISRADYSLTKISKKFNLKKNLDIENQVLSILHISFSFQQEGSPILKIKKTLKNKKNKKIHSTKSSK